MINMWEVKGHTCSLFSSYAIWIKNLCAGMPNETNIVIETQSLIVFTQLPVRPETKSILCSGSHDFFDNWGVRLQTKNNSLLATYII